MEYWFACDVVAAVVALVLLGVGVVVMYLKLCRPPLEECIVIEGGVVFLYDKV